MVLRTGAIRGPGRSWDFLGAAAGFALPIILVVFVVSAGHGTARYSHIRDTISVLGAAGHPYEGWFTAVNVADAVLIALFAHATYRRLPVGLTTVTALGFVAVGAVLIGVFPCTLVMDSGVGHCGQDIHAVVAGLTLGAIVTFQIAAAIHLWRGRLRWIRWMSCASAAAAAVLAVATVVATTVNASFAGLVERLVWAIGYGWVVVAAAMILRTTKAPPLRTFNIGKLQQKILRARPWRHAAYILYEVVDPMLARQWVRSAIDDEVVCAAGDASTERSPSVTLAFSHRGLAKLVTAYPNAGSAVPAFCEGMKARASWLGDVDVSAPEYWEQPWRDGEIDVLAWVHASEQSGLVAAVDRLDRLDPVGGIRRLHVQEAHQTVDDEGRFVEPFGFRDGIGQPWVEGISLKASQRPGRGKLDDWGAWRPIALGEFILGEPDESEDVAPLPEPADLFRHGSFLVVRKLAQNVSAWNDFIEREAGVAGIDPKRLAALLVGRHHDGRPVWLDDPRHAEINDFTYEDDAEGFHCPLGAHIRRAHPRHAAGFRGALANRRRIIRRGMTYFDESAAPEWARGLMFVAVNARIVDQFEFVQHFWLNDGDRQKLGANRDAVVGRGTGSNQVVLQSPAGPHLIANTPQFVRTLGGEYFFVPSMNGLTALASG